MADWLPTIRINVTVLELLHQLWSHGYDQFLDREWEVGYVASNEMLDDVSGFPSRLYGERKTEIGIFVPEFEGRELPIKIAPERLIERLGAAWHIDGIQLRRLNSAEPDGADIQIWVEDASEIFLEVKDPRLYNGFVYFGRSRQVLLSADDLGDANANDQTWQSVSRFVDKLLGGKRKK